MSTRVTSRGPRPSVALQERAFAVRDALLIFGVAIALRLVHVWQMRGSIFFSVLMGDSRGYDAWARQLAGGDWMGRDVFYQAPLYPYFLGSLYAIGGHDLLLVRIVQVLLGALSCVALAYAASWLLSTRAGLVAGLMLAFYPPAIFFDALIQKSVLDVLFVCVALALVAHIATAPRDGMSWMWLGVTIGALALTRENALVLAVVLLVWAITRAPSRAAIFVGGAALVLLPVAARNYAVGGGFYLTTSQFGSNLYIGNHPGADGSYVALREGRGSPEYERTDATELAQEAMGRTLTPSEVSSYWTDRTIHFVTSQPGEWLALLARKVRLLVSSTEVIDTESQESHAEYSTVLQFLGAVWHFGVLLPLGVVGFLVLWSERRRLWPVYAMAAAYAASVVLFYVVARYRLPLVPFVMIFAAGGVLAILQSPRKPLAIALAAVFAVVANWPLYSSASQQAITENNLGTALQENGRTEEAIARYQRALALKPDYQPAMSNLGSALRAAGRVEEALRTYDTALSAGGDSAAVYLNRGNALMQQGRVPEAIESFRQAVARERDSDAASRALANALYDYGTAAIEAGRFDVAVTALREALAIRPDYAEAHNNIGIALASQGKLADAIREWEAALKINPALDDARRNLELARRTK